ncbi:phospholipid-binding protein MlaC [uncultured Amaricoccus sp.]|uniref:MlaC/ttg2D family ABC transporter substrate-binding protein n=1 Tax=uncultured Amaricoccus sp. TaxID=339341 RepID=UPI00262D8B99|nr:ABC transporter substrate-binding protein [uncultured Amaricoccus sp.]
MTIEIARRDLLAGGAALMLVGFLGRTAWADAVGGARQLVTALSAELQKMVNSGQAQSGQIATFQQIIGRYADMGPVAASILGQPWRTASPAQKQAFVAAFQSYFSRKYGNTFSQYKNASIEVSGAKDGGKSGVLVSSVVKRPGQANIAVDWQISARSGAPKVVNLIIEGVSMLANERAEVGAMLDAQGGDLDRLIAQMSKSS